uniref:autoinducer binding domain-containing protein n=1 Tax=Bradyrhizobium sp. DOA9 TaxID=1126627 RepID=UPI00046A3090|nr:autoinducer binding domain-containing protein [Bradyrhizobium sp. DOA9]
MTHTIPTFIERLIESRSQNALQESMAEVARKLDLSSFAYLSLPRQPSGSPRLISTYPACWTAHYLSAMRLLILLFARLLRTPNRSNGASFGVAGLF